MKYMLMLILLLFCTYAFAAETTDIKVSLDYPREIKSNEKKLFELNVYNGENIVLHDLELSVLDHDDLEITLNKTRIDSIEPKETVIIYMEIITNNTYYFDKDTTIALKISNNEFTKDFGYKLTIKPVENFWFFIILAIALMLTILFIIIFIKLNRGEENAG
jgi:uncharacterized membrane protein